MQKIRSYWMKRITGTALSFSLILLAPTAVYAESPWLLQADGWHYYQENGLPGTGWIEDNGVFYYLLADGLSITDAITPDGYYVDVNGVWRRRKETILGVPFTSFDRFLPVGSEWDKSPSILLLSEQFNRIFGASRRIRVSKDRIEYVVFGSNTKNSGIDMNFTGSQDTAKQNTVNQNTDAGTVLAVLYQEPTQGRYCLELKMKLYPGSTDEQQTATYDYALFKAMLYQISSSPEILEEALLSAWQGDNRWQINRQEWVRAGDSMILYTPGKESGRFFIRPAAEGD